MGGGIAKTFAGGRGSIRCQAVSGKSSGGLRNKRKAAWAQEKFLEMLKAKRAQEKHDLLFGEEDDYGSYGYGGGFENKD